MESDFYVKKIYKYDENWMNNEWLDDYREFTKGKDYYVKIYNIEYHNDHFLVHMENLDFYCSVKNLIRYRNEYHQLLNYNDIENLYKIILKTFTDSINSRKDNNFHIPYYYVHDDFHLGNILFLKDRSFKIIDPNAFIWKRGAPCNERTMSTLNECLFLCMQVYYNIQYKELKKLNQKIDKYSLLKIESKEFSDKQNQFLSEIFSDFLEDKL
tara:strand:- start:1642 stop:2277 length:636 start_codon:yes stop_codon:yes gene_type:complete